MNVLVINAGSSSLKYQLFNMDNKEVLAKGLCERIGIDGRLTHTNPNKSEKYKADIPMKDHADAIRAVINILTDKEWGVIDSMSEIDAVGHRVVHGGEYFADSVLINDQVIDAIKACVPLAPLHNTPNLIGIDACKDVMGADIPQVAVFDTAFHQTMPPVSYMYAIPYKYYEKFHIRRYGFHGTSHKFVSAQAAQILGKPIEELNIVTCHLGNGSSVTAVKGGKSIDTSMGFTPLAGTPMGTRSGDIDPAIVSYLADHLNKTADDILTILNKKSGMEGVSGVSSDFRDLDAAIDSGNERAELAKDIFSQNVKKLIASYAAEMGGLDVIVFTAGVGENDAGVRADSVSGLEFMGVKIDEAKNSVRGTVDISADDSKVKVLVIPTNEELVIAEDTERLVEVAK